MRVGAHWIIDAGPPLPCWVPPICRERDPAFGEAIDPPLIFPCEFRVNSSSGFRARRVGRASFNLLAVKKKVQVHLRMSPCITFMGLRPVTPALRRPAIAPSGGGRSTSGKRKQRA